MRYSNRMLLLVLQTLISASSVVWAGEGVCNVEILEPRAIYYGDDSTLLAPQCSQPPHNPAATVIWDKNNQCGLGGRVQVTNLNGLVFKGRSGDDAIDDKGSADIPWHKISVDGGDECAENLASQCGSRVMNLPENCLVFGQLGSSMSLPDSICHVDVTAQIMHRLSNNPDHEIKLSVPVSYRPSVAVDTVGSLRYDAFTKRQSLVYTLDHDVMNFTMRYRAVYPGKDTFDIEFQHCGDDVDDLGIPGGMIYQQVHLDSDQQVLAFQHNFPEHGMFPSSSSKRYLPSGRSYQVLAQYKDSSGASRDYGCYITPPSMCFSVVEKDRMLGVSLNVSRGDIPDLLSRASTEPASIKARGVGMGVEAVNVTAVVFDTLRECLLETRATQRLPGAPLATRPPILAAIADDNLIFAIDNRDVAQARCSCGRQRLFTSIDGVAAAAVVVDVSGAAVSVPSILGLMPASPRVVAACLTSQPGNNTGYLAMLDAQDPARIVLREPVQQLACHRIVATCQNRVFFVDANRPGLLQVAFLDDAGVLVSHAPLTPFHRILGRSANPEAGTLCFPDGRLLFAAMTSRERLSARYQIFHPDTGAVEQAWQGVRAGLPSVTAAPAVDAVFVVGDRCQVWRASLTNTTASNADLVVDRCSQLSSESIGSLAWTRRGLFMTVHRFLQLNDSDLGSQVSFLHLAPLAADALSLDPAYQIGGETGQTHSPWHVRHIQAIGDILYMSGAAHGLPHRRDDIQLLAWDTDDDRAWNDGQASRGLVAVTDVFDNILSMHAGTHRMFFVGRGGKTWPDDVIKLLSVFGSHGPRSPGLPLAKPRETLPVMFDSLSATVARNDHYNFDVSLDYQPSEFPDIGYMRVVASAELPSDLGLVSSSRSRVATACVSVEGDDALTMLVPNLSNLDLPVKYTVWAPGMTTVEFRVGVQGRLIHTVALYLCTGNDPAAETCTTVKQVRRLNDTQSVLAFSISYQDLKQATDPALVEGVTYVAFVQAVDSINDRGTAGFSVLFAPNEQLELRKFKSYVQYRLGNGQLHAASGYLNDQRRKAQQCLGDSADLPDADVFVFPDFTDELDLEDFDVCGHRLDSAGLFACPIAQSGQPDALQCMSCPDDALITLHADLSIDDQGCSTTRSLDLRTTRTWQPGTYHLFIRGDRDSFGIDPICSPAKSLHVYPESKVEITEVVLPRVLLPGAEAVELVIGVDTVRFRYQSQGPFASCLFASSVFRHLTGEFGFTTHFHPPGTCDGFPSAEISGEYAQVFQRRITCVSVVEGRVYTPQLLSLSAPFWHHRNDLTPQQLFDLSDVKVAGCDVDLSSGSLRVRDVPTSLTVGTALRIDASTAAVQGCSTIKLALYAVPMLGSAGESAVRARVPKPVFLHRFDTRSNVIDVVVSVTDDLVDRAVYRFELCLDGLGGVAAACIVDTGAPMVQFCLESRIDAAVLASVPNESNFLTIDDTTSVAMLNVTLSGCADQVDVLLRPSSDPSAEPILLVDTASLPIGEATLVIPLRFDRCSNSSVVLGIEYDILVRLADSTLEPIVVAAGPHGFATLISSESDAFTAGLVGVGQHRIVVHDLHGVFLAPDSAPPHVSVEIGGSRFRRAELWQHRTRDPVGLPAAAAASQLAWSAAFDASQPGAGSWDVALGLPRDGAGGWYDLHAVAVARNGSNIQDFRVAVSNGVQVCLINSTDSVFQSPILSVIDTSSVAVSVNVTQWCCVSSVPVARVYSKHSGILVLERLLHRTENATVDLAAIVSMSELPPGLYRVDVAAWSDSALHMDAGIFEVLDDTSGLTGINYDYEGNLVGSATAFGVVTAVGAGALVASNRKRRRNSAAPAAAAV